MMGREDGHLAILKGDSKRTEQEIGEEDKRMASHER